jgi:hypothetical protein
MSIGLRDWAHGCDSAWGLSADRRPTMTPSASQSLQELQNTRIQCLGSMFGADRGSTAAPINRYGFSDRCRWCGRSMQVPQQLHNLLPHADATLVHVPVWPADHLGIGAPLQPAGHRCPRTRHQSAGRSHVSLQSVERSGDHDGVLRLCFARAFCSWFSAVIPREYGVPDAQVIEQVRAVVLEHIAVASEDVPSRHSRPQNMSWLRCRRSRSLPTSRQRMTEREDLLACRQTRFDILS